MNKPYQMPHLLSANATASLTAFLVISTGSVSGTWHAPIAATDQRRLFGRFLGRGRIVVNGEKKTLKRYVSVCFGTDSDCRDNLTWDELAIRPDNREHA